MGRKFFVTQYALIFKNKRLLMLKNALHKEVFGRWVFPGGHIDMELDPIEALKRELKEETDLDLLKATPIRTNIYKYPGGWRYRVYFKCTVKGNIKLSREHNEYRWITKKDVKEKLMIFRDEELRKVVLEFLDK